MQPRDKRTNYQNNTYINQKPKLRMNPEELNHEMEVYTNNTSSERRPRDKLRAKMTYKTKLPLEKALKSIRLEKNTVGVKYEKRTRDAANFEDDINREDAEEEKWRQAENDYKRFKERFTEATLAISSDTATREQHEVIRHTDEDLIDEWIQNAREKRLKSAKNKHEFMRTKEAIEKELAHIRQDTGANHIRKDADGNYWKTWSSAPCYVMQNIKRSEAEVARDICIMFCTADGLQSTDFKKSVTLLKEYKEVFTSDDEMWDILREIIDYVETNKSHLTRSKLAEACYPCLNIENQLRHHKALEIAKTGGNEMSDLIIPFFRLQKKQKEGKTDRQLQMKDEIRDKKLQTEYNRVTGRTSSYNKRSYGNKKYQSNYRQNQPYRYKGSRYNKGSYNNRSYNSRRTSNYSNNSSYNKRQNNNRGGFRNNSGGSNNNNNRGYQYGGRFNNRNNTNNKRGGYNKSNNNNRNNRNNNTNNRNQDNNNRDDKK